MSKTKCRYCRIDPNQNHFLPPYSLLIASILHSHFTLQKTVMLITPPRVITKAQMQWLQWMVIATSTKCCSRQIRCIIIATQKVVGQEFWLIDQHDCIFPISNGYFPFLGSPYFSHPWVVIVVNYFCFLWW